MGTAMACVAWTPGAPTSGAWATAARSNGGAPSSIAAGRWTAGTRAVPGTEAGRPPCIPVAAVPQADGSPRHEQKPAMGGLLLA